MLKDYVNKMLSDMGREKYEKKLKPLLTITISQEEKEKDEKDQESRERAMNPLGIG